MRHEHWEGFRALPIGLLVSVLTLVGCPGWAEEHLSRKVAVTFDDLPVAGATNKSLRAQETLTANLLESISSRDIPAIGFVNEGKMYLDSAVEPAQVALLQNWLDAGMTLGNHSYSHHDLNLTPLEDFQADVIRGEKVTKKLLKQIGAKLEYFRHPYLHTGTELKKRDAFARFLRKNNYKVAPVSIDNSEWIFAWAYDLALKNNDAALARRIGGDYVDYMLQMFAFYEDQSVKLFERNIDHVLLVHANTLNSVWFGELADRLATIGYEFVTLDEALLDPAYASPDRYTGSGGITWIHRWAITRNVDPAMFHGEPITPNYILQITGLAESSNEQDE